LSIFKAYDIRGVYPKEINEELAYRIGRAFVSFLKPKTVVIGRDVRLSSDSLFKALAKGITEQGADVIDIGLASTPMMYFANANYGYDAGIMITASHNPKEYNGFKMVTKGALPLSGDSGIMDIKELVEKNDFEDSGNGGEISEKEIKQDYIKHILSFAKKDKMKSFKIVVDAGNGMSALDAPKILKEIGCDDTELYFELDGTFPNHLPNPLEEKNIKELRKKVIEEKADMGLAFDGDADRMFIVDEKGEVVPADFIATLVAQKILKEKPGSTILFDLRSSLILSEKIEEAGGRPVMSRVGHSFIKREMREKDAVFASELSAHYYMKDNFFIESPFLVVFKIFEIMTETGNNVSELVKPLKKYYASGEINFTVEDKEGVMKKLEEKYSDGDVSELDGVRIAYDNWWFNVRPSNTEPLLRLNLEAKSRELMEEKKKEISGIIKS